jgi:hypothetical protein
MSVTTAITKVDLSQYNIKKIASGKVREIFEIDDQTLLFVATDRISAYDVILNNVSILIVEINQSCALVGHAGIARLVPPVGMTLQYIEAQAINQHEITARYPTSHTHLLTLHNRAFPPKALSSPNSPPTGST